MSSSTKKQLRREQVAAKKAEQQQTAKQESKRMKIYTSIFCVILALMVLLVAVVGVNNSGFIEPRVTALKVGDTNVTAAELNMFYINAITEFYEQNGSYITLYGLQSDIALDRQISIDTVNTWDNYFLASAEDNIHNFYSLYNAAIADENYADAEAVLERVSNNMETMKQNASQNNVNLNDSLRSNYGKGVKLDTYQKYMEVLTLAQEYYAYYANSLTYNDEQIAEYDAKDPIANNLYNYSAYVIYSDDYLEGGTEDENGKVTYSDEEKAAALAASEAVAKELVSAGYATGDELEGAVNKLPISENEEASSALLKNQADVRASDLPASMKEWITDPARQPGDITYTERVSTINNETAVNGYNVIIFEGVEDNKYPLVNIRHILVNFEGGTTDETTGKVTYSPAEKEAAKAKAQEIYDAWLAGDADAESFAALATEKTSDPGSKETGGLYEDVYPGEMVTAFNDWCFAEGRKIGDHGLVETEYGYHIMFLDGFSETSYREYLITNDMLSADVAAWQADLLEKYPLTEMNLSRVDRSLVLGNYLYYGYGN